MAEQPNDASRKDKAEGERWTDESSERQAGITPHSVDEEVSNEEDEEGPNQEDEGDPVMPSDDTTVDTKI